MNRKVGAELITESYWYVRGTREGGAAPAKACSGPPPALFMMSTTFVTRERRTGYEHWNDFTAILNRLKTSPALTVHACARTCYGAPRTGLRWRTTVYMTLFTLRAHVRTFTDPHGERPFVASTTGKAWCAAVASWQSSLLDGCCCCCT